MPDDEQASRVVPPLASLEQEIPRSSILLDIWQMQQAMEARSVTAERQRNEILVELRGVQREMTDMRSEIALNKAFRLQFEAWLKVLKLIILGFAALGAYVVSQSSQLTKWWK